MAFTKAVQAVPMERIVSVLSKCGIDQEDLLEMFKEDAIPMRSKGASIVIGIEGGSATGFSFRELDSPDDFQVLVADYDVEDNKPSTIATIRCPKFGKSEALIRDLGGDFSDDGATFVNSVSEAYDVQQTCERGEAESKETD